MGLMESWPRKKKFTRQFCSFCSSRVGRRFDNQKLYCNVLDEMARCGKFTGRAALLTGDMNNMMKVAVSCFCRWFTFH